MLTAYRTRVKNIINCKGYQKVKRKSGRKSRWRLLHQYYSYTGFYSFLGKSLKKSALPILGFVGAILFVHYFIIDLHVVLHEFTENYHSLSILGLFYASETILGLLPPEVFIAWTYKTTDPIFFLSMLALLSYAGGVTAYQIGFLLSKQPKIHKYMEERLSKHMKQVQKWGAMLIVAGALLPLPFAIVSLASGLINYRFKLYLLWGLFRIPRFYLYAVALINLV